MTQDCLDPHSIAGDSSRFPKGIHILGADGESASSIKGLYPQQLSEPSVEPAPWSYLMLHHMSSMSLVKWLDEYNARLDVEPQPYFVHQSVEHAYRHADGTGGVKKKTVATISGLIFLQGTVEHLQDFLSRHFPHYHLVNDCATHAPASIPDRIMKPFMHVLQSNPSQITFLDDSFRSFARNRVLLRVLTGPFKGYEGYIVRIDRDRQLVFDFAGYAVAIRGVHKEMFEEVK